MFQMAAIMKRFIGDFALKRTRLRIRARKDLCVQRGNAEHYHQDTRWTEPRRPWAYSCEEMSERRYSGKRSNI